MHEKIWSDDPWDDSLYWQTQNKPPIRQGGWSSSDQPSSFSLIGFHISQDYSSFVNRSASIATPSCRIKTAETN